MGFICNSFVKRYDHKVILILDRQQNQKLETDFQRYAYLVAIILWIIFGMGYIFAVVDVISGSLKSSR